MAPRTGLFTWRENITTDVDRAKAFYSEVVGWAWQDVPMGPDRTYSLALAGGKQVGGLMLKSPTMPVPPCWTAYVSVDNADTTVAATSKHGGQVHMPATAIPGIGRFAILSASDRSAFAILEPTDPAPMPTERPKAGEFCWESLCTNDKATAKAFYSAIFGWTFHDDTTIHRGADMFADITDAPAGAPNAWLSHVLVDKVADANARVQRMGGKVLMHEIVVPSFGAFSVVADPAGAAFAMFEARTA